MPRFEKFVRSCFPPFDSSDSFPQATDIPPTLPNLINGCGRPKATPLTQQQEKKYS